VLRNVRRDRELVGRVAQFKKIIRKDQTETKKPKPNLKTNIYNQDCNVCAFSADVSDAPRNGRA
jgi:hypothetical protein